MDVRRQRSLAAALAAPELTPAISPVYNIAPSMVAESQANPLRMRSPSGYAAVYEWHQKRAHELVAGLGVAMVGHAWQFCEPAEGGPGYHARVASIIEQLVESQPVHWAQLWPGGLELGQLLLAHPALAHGREVVEIGTGLGTAAVCAALAGATAVWATDVEPRALAFAAANAAENGLVSTVHPLRWDFTQPPPAEISDRTFGLLLAADVTYFQAAAARVAELAIQLVEPGGALLFVDGTDRPYDMDDNIEQLRAWLCAHGMFAEETLFEGERELAGPQAGVVRSVRASIFIRAA